MKRSLEESVQELQQKDPQPRRASCVVAEEVGWSCFVLGVFVVLCFVMVVFLLCRVVVLVFSEESLSDGVRLLRQLFSLKGQRHKPQLGDAQTTSMWKKRTTKIQHRLKLFHFEGFVFPG